MNKYQKFNQNQSGQAALEAAIILIAFVVVASVFAFAVLSAGTASTEKGQQAIYAGLEGVQASMEVKGAVIAQSTDKAAVQTVVFTVASVAGGDPINLDTADPQVVIAYRTDTVQESNLDFSVNFIVNVGDEDCPVGRRRTRRNYGDVARYWTMPGNQHRLHARSQAADRRGHCHQPHHARRARKGHGTALKQLRRKSMRGAAASPSFMPRHSNVGASELQEISG